MQWEYKNENPLVETPEALHCFPSLVSTLNLWTDKSTVVRMHCTSSGRVSNDTYSILSLQKHCFSEAL